MSWDTGDMSAALPDLATTQDIAPQEASAAPETAKVNPQDAGWVPKVAYDYATYTKTNKELQQQHEAQAAQEPQSEVPVNNNDENQDDAVGGLREGDWAGNAAVYEFNGDFGDVGPRFEALEKQLFGAGNHTRTGIKFEKIAMLEVIQEGTHRIKPVKRFEDAGLHPVMLENTRLAGYLAPTPVQAYTLPVVLEGKDLIACAQTGSGKTAAFLIPILSKLMGKAKKLCAPRPNPATFQPGVTPPVRAEPLVLIVAPTRELATQIFDEARRFCYRTMFRPCVVYGGGPLGEQISLLAKGCDVLIGTPGRLVDFINRPQLLTLRRLKYMVIDEADEMVQQDWEAELKQIMSGGDQEEGNINYLMFSATFPKVCAELAEQHLAHNHARIRVGRAGSTHDNIKQDILFCEPSMKRQCLVDLLMAMPPARTIIFVNSKRAADEVDDFLFNSGFPCTSIHGDRTQREREDSLRAFRKGKSPILIATGVSSRGLDIHNVMHVINFDLPSSMYGGIQEYTHRIGRTGRIGNLGLATSFYNSRDADLAEILVKTLLETRQKIPDFLHEYIPEGFTPEGEGDITKLVFDAPEEEATEETADGGGWGEDAAPAEGGWNGVTEAPEPTPAPGGWGAHPDVAPVVATAEGGWAPVVAEPVQPIQPQPIVQAQAASQGWNASPAPVAPATQSWGQPSGPPQVAAPIAAPVSQQQWGQQSAPLQAAQYQQQAPVAPAAQGWGQPSAPPQAPAPVASYQQPAPVAQAPPASSGWGVQQPPQAQWSGPPGSQPPNVQAAPQPKAAPKPAAPTGSWDAPVVDNSGWGNGSTSHAAW